jgi:hypothetical protein
MQERAVVSEWKRGVEGAIAAGELGPVSDFFEEGPLMHDSDTCPDFYKALPLKPHIQALEKETMITLLKSENLNVQNESDAYYLFGAWLYQSPHVTDEASIPLQAIL